MLSKFFIQRPIFCQCIGDHCYGFRYFSSVMNLPVERYPDIAPPKILCQPTIVVQMHKRLSKVLSNFRTANTRD